jgi:site-specific recombinase XerC
VASGHSASKIHNVLMPVRVLCRFALERDELLLNPTTNLRPPVANGRRERVASPQEAAGLIEALPEEPRCLWWTAALRGHEAEAAERFEDYLTRPANSTPTA